MPQVVDASNYQSFVETGSVPEFKPPVGETKAPNPETKAAPNGTKAPADGTLAHHSTSQPRENGKFTSTVGSDKNTPASTPSAPKADGANEDDEFSEKVRRKIGEKHRLQKEAEEFAKAEFRRATAAEQRAERLQKELEAERQKSGPAPAEAKEPIPDDFKTVAEYTAALVDYRVNAKLKAKEAEAEQARLADEKAKREQQFAQRVSAAREKYDDFETVLQSLAGTQLDRVHSDVIEYIQESEHGAELLYHLGKNSETLQRLHKLSPRRFIAELGKLEMKFDGTPSPAPAKEPTATLSEAATATPPAARAPAPITPLDTSGAAPVAKKPDEMNVAELRALRREEDRQRRAQGR